MGSILGGVMPASESFDACEPSSFRSWGSVERWRKAHNYHFCANCESMNHCDSCAGDCLSRRELIELAHPQPVHVYYR